MTHHPKASMCAVCVHKSRDCSHLPFATMRPIERYDGGVVVRCVEFAKELWSDSDERRMDVIGQNGNTAEHYGKN